MVPTLAATLGVKGHRPVVATRDNKDLLYVLGVVNLSSAALHTNTLERRRATHNRPFDALAALKRSVRASLSYFQTVRDRVKTLLLSRRKQKKAKQTASASV